MEKICYNNSIRFQIKLGRDDAMISGISGVGASVYTAWSSMQRQRPSAMETAQQRPAAAEDAQAYNDMVQMCNRFEKKLHDLELTRQVAENVSIPVIASGGAGTKEHFYEALAEGGADAALAASLFHYKELEIMELKQYLAQKGVPVRA